MSEVERATGENTTVMHRPSDDSAPCGNDEKASVVSSACGSETTTDPGESERPRQRDVHALHEGASSCEPKALPESVMNGIHAYAYDFYQQGRLTEAEAFFRFLCLYDFYNADYAMGLAAVFQLQGRHRQAIDLYGVAMRLGFTDPSPVFHAGQCFLKLGEIEDARECFAYVLSETSDPLLEERAQTYLASIGGPPRRDDLTCADPFQSDVRGAIDE